MFNGYIPPISSRYYEVTGLNNGIEILCQCVLNVCASHEDCFMIIFGDFNAKTGCLNTNFSKDLTDISSNVLEDSRLAIDKTLNNCGERLLELCVGFELTILNG